MNNEQADALIGQMAADACLLHSLCSVVIALVPEAEEKLRAQVEAMGLLTRHQLPKQHQPAFDERLRHLQPLFSEHQPEPPPGIRPGS